MNHWKSTLAVIGIGQLISILTSTIVGFSIIFWISNEFKSPTALSLAILAGFLPQFVLGLFAGVYVDRWNRKKTMFYSDLFIAFCTLCLFIVITKGYKDLSFFYLLTACRSIGSTFHAPALQASIPLLVPKHHLVRVSGLYHSIQSFSEVIAPVVGASLVVWLPIQYILLIDVIGAVAACLTLLCVQIPSLQKTKVLPDFKKRTDGMLAYLAAYNGHFAFIRMLYAGDFCPYACFYVISFYDASAFQRKHFANGSCGNGLGLRGIVGRFSTCL
ncbi:MFS transporter [Bacteroides fragilis]|nr:MFS transporter [Bacteroides fragilis]